ncbi:MAG: polyphosphate polymerase domain-containing protein [Lachnospiraceae bacterium]|nr:polyphosphate polymerase domain-containing protein [Lachnospiraceae bacterium]
MSQTVFNRYEKKYLLSETVYEKLRCRLMQYMAEDEYGLHTICNIYYDTPDSYLISHSLEKPIYKEKLRLRSYGVPTLDTQVFLEIKKKYKGIVNKRRISLSLQDACMYLEMGIYPNDDSQILREIDFLINRYKLSRSLFLAYDRIALYAKDDPEFRVTFDQHIRSRRNNLCLEYGDCGRLLLSGDQYLMETKVLGATPLWFSGILSDLQIYPISFSKYGTVYQKEKGQKVC